MLLIFSYLVRYPQIKYKGYQMANIEKTKRWLSPTDVVDEYGIAINTQAKYRMKGIIPYVKINRIIRYDRMLLDAWLEAHTVPTIKEIKNASC